MEFYCLLYVCGGYGKINFSETVRYKVAVGSEDICCQRKKINDI